MSNVCIAPYWIPLHSVAQQCLPCALPDENHMLSEGPSLIWPYSALHLRPLLDRQSWLNMGYWPKSVLCGRGICTEAWTRVVPMLSPLTQDRGPQVYFFNRIFFVRHSRRRHRRRHRPRDSTLFFHFVEFTSFNHSSKERFVQLECTASFKRKLKYHLFIARS